MSNDNVEDSIDREDAPGYTAHVADMLALPDAIAMIAQQHPDFDREMEAARAEASFALALADARHEAKMSQSDLSALTGIKQPQIARYEKGAKLNVSQVVRIAKAFNKQVVFAPDGAVRFEPARRPRLKQR